MSEWSLLLAPPRAPFLSQIMGQRRPPSSSGGGVMSRSVTLNLNLMAEALGGLNLGGMILDRDLHGSRGGARETSDDGGYCRIAGGACRMQLMACRLALHHQGGGHSLVPDASRDVIMWCIRSADPGPWALGQQAACRARGRGMEEIGCET